MSSGSKEEKLERSLIAFERAKAQYEKARKAYQDDVDAIILKPVHVREISRGEAVKLARAIEDDTAFALIMEMGLLPEALQNTEEGEDDEDMEGGEDDLEKEEY